ncbi:ArnT family glycosyltransferase [Xanthobacteraceae bacterium A53D]
MRNVAADRSPAHTPTDTVALALLAVIGLLSVLTFRDYGLGWDDFTHSQYGNLLLKYYSSGFTDDRVFSFVNLYYYGGGFDMLAALIAKWLPVDVFDVRRLLGAAFGLVGLALVWRTGRRLAGPVGGLAAMALLAICPLYYGHMFMNAKDAPFAVAMAGLIYSLVRAFDEYPRPTWRTIAWFGLFLGLTIGTRVLGVLSGAYCLAAAAFLLVAEGRALGIRPAIVRLARFAGWLALGLPLGYAVLAVIWPWAVVDPLNPIHALQYYSHFWEVPWREMFDGRPVLVPDMPRTYVPILFGIQMPEMFLAFALAGMAGAVVFAVFGKDTPNRRARFVFVLAAALVPVMITVIMRPVMYNGIRHFVFVTPALALLGGAAVAWLVARVAQAKLVVRGAVAALLLLGFAMPVKEFATLHPYQYTYYNNFVGGVRGADANFMLDYWGLAFKQAVEQLDEYVETHRRALPQGRKFRVAVCGPHNAAAAELGPRFETTYDTKGADFALMLGEFYCADVQAPVIGKVEREGVTYAKVYDVRGRSFPSVFAGGK